MNDDDPRRPGPPKPQVRGRIRLWAAFAVLWLAALAFLVQGLVAAGIKDHELSVHGIPVQALITDIEFQGKSDLAVTVFYKTSCCVRTATLHETKRDVRPGQLITLRYDPADPGNVRSAGNSEYLDTYIVLGGLGIGALAGFGWSVRSLVGWVQHRKLVARIWARAE